MRLEAIKHQILTKLGLRTRPDVNRTLATVPRHLALETLYRAEAQFSRYPLPDNTRNDRREDVYSTEFLYGGNEYSYSRNLDQRVDDDSAKDNGRIASSYRGYEGGEGEDREPEEEIDDFYARTSEIITFAEPGKYSPLRSISGSIFVPRTIGRVEACTRPTLPRTLPRYLSILDSNFFIYLSPFYLRTRRKPTFSIRRFAPLAITISTLENHAFPRVGKERSVRIRWLVDSFDRHPRLNRPVARVASERTTRDITVGHGRARERRYAENVTNRHLGSHACVATRVQPRGLVDMGVAPRPSIVRSVVQ